MRKHSRRSFVLMGLGFLAGCASDNKSDDLAKGGERGPLPEPYHASPRPRIYRPGNTTGLESRDAVMANLPYGVRPRSMWATRSSIPVRMDPMTSIHRLTVHHDGMAPFFASSESSSIARMDAIRHAHQSSGWGDIGYHFVVDRAGRVWEGRPLVYQGAHVKYNNEGNIGLMCLGNFDRQEPTEAQLRAVQTYVRLLTDKYRVRSHAIFTHQELRPTACPGRGLQRYMVSARSSGAFA